MNYTEIREGLYAIKAHIPDLYILYAPQKRQCFYVDNTPIEIIEKAANAQHISTSPAPEITQRVKEVISGTNVQPFASTVGMNSNRTVILLTDACNLGCVYCYAQESRSQKTLDRNKIKNIIDYAMKSGGNNKHFTFLGGGEPLACWDTLRWSIDYINEIKKDKIVTIGLQTNATLLDEDKVIWLKENNVSVGCSFDILPDIQNSQRPFAFRKDDSFQCVDKAIKLLIEHNVIPKIRTTITKANCRRMSEMVSFVAENYPEIKQVHLEHVSSPGLTWDNYYRDFVDNFHDAKQLADKKGIYLNNSIIRSVSAVRSRFCGGEFCVTPTGDIVACHRVSSPNEKLFSVLRYGIVNDTEVIIEQEKAFVVNEIYSAMRRTECQSCFAKYHCAGACCNNKLSYSDSEFDELCNFAKEMILIELERRLYLR